MIDRKARNKVYAAMSAFVQGRVSGSKVHELVELFLRDVSHDPAIAVAVATVPECGKRQLLRRPLDADSRRRILYAMLMLKSDFQYRWPSWPRPTLPDRFRVWMWGCSFSLLVLGLPLVFGVLKGGIAAILVLLSVLAVIVLIDRLLFRWDARLLRQWEELGDYAVWPFFSTDEYHQAEAAHRSTVQRRAPAAFTEAAGWRKPD